MRGETGVAETIPLPLGSRLLIVIVIQRSPELVDRLNESVKRFRCACLEITMKRPLVNLMFLLLCAVGVRSASAEMISFTDHVSGQEAPEGPPPWIEVEFLQDSADNVRLIVQNGGLVNSEFVSELFLNVNPSANLATFTATHQSGVPGTVTLLENGYDANGEGLYDLRIQFPEAPVVDQFGAGDSSEFLIQATGLTPAWFLYPDVGGDGVPRLGAARVGGIFSPGFEAWIGVPVPEPTGVSLLVGGVVSLCGLRRRK